MTEATRPGARKARARMLADVKRGLEREQKALSPKYFYDRAGSELFEEITRLPEYYLTRAEIRILEGPVRRWVCAEGPAALVELGAGSARKTRILLDAMIRPEHREGTGVAGNDGTGPTFVPVDVSGDFLQEAARTLRRDYASLRIRPLVADFSDPAFAGGNGESPFGLRPEERPAFFAFLGSTIGNFEPPAAVSLLSRIRRRMRPGDAFLLGADLRPGAEKPRERIEEAYNDARGVTARFNVNVLRVLNRELGTDFDPDGFRHRAYYDSERHRIEMHLVARQEQVVRLPDGTEVLFERGESLRTEVSHKYDRAALADLFGAVGLELDAWFPGDDGLYAMAVARPSQPDGVGLS